MHLAGNRAGDPDQAAPERKPVGAPDQGPARWATFCGTDPGRVTWVAPVPAEGRSEHSADPINSRRIVSKRSRARLILALILGSTVATGEGGVDDARAADFDVLIRGGTRLRRLRQTAAAGRRRASAATGSPASATWPTRPRRPSSTPRDLAVAPGFINMLSWSTESLLADGRGAERDPPGRHHADHGRGLVDGAASTTPSSKRMKAEQTRHQVRHRVDHAGRIPRLPRAAQGVSQNVASFLGATTVREYVHRPGEPQADARTNWSGCAKLVEQEMRDGRPGHRLGPGICRRPTTPTPRS